MLSVFDPFTLALFFFTCNCVCCAGWQHRWAQAHGLHDTAGGDHGRRWSAAHVSVHRVYATQGRVRQPDLPRVRAQQSRGKRLRQLKHQTPRFCLNECANSDPSFWITVVMMCEHSCCYGTQLVCFGPEVWSFSPSTVPKVFVPKTWTTVILVNFLFSLVSLREQCLFTSNEADARVLLH